MKAIEVIKVRAGGFQLAGPGAFLPTGLLRPAPGAVLGAAAGAPLGLGAGSSLRPPGADGLKAP